MPEYRVDVTSQTATDLCPSSLCFVRAGETVDLPGLGPCFVREATYQERAGGESLRLVVGTIHDQRIQEGLDAR